LSGHFEEAVLGLLMPPDEFDAYQMHIAMKVNEVFNICVLLHEKIVPVFLYERFIFIIRLIWLTVY